MDFESFLNELRASPAYGDQTAYTRVLEPREARFADTARPLAQSCRAYLEAAGIDRLYRHQAEAIDAVREGRDVLVVTGAASGKSLCYQLPLLEMLQMRSDATALLLHPTKALSQDQFQTLSAALAAARLAGSLAGVFDGDTAAAVRRKLRDEGRVVLTNPDMLHAALLPQHTRWAAFLQRLAFVVIDELHTYSGLFGSNAANLFRRIERVPLRQPPADGLVLRNCGQSRGGRAEADRAAAGGDRR